MSEKYDTVRAAAVELLADLALIQLSPNAEASAERLDQAIKAPDLFVAKAIPMRLTCPDCGQLHVDEGEWATRVHHTHSCQNCGLTWRPAVVATVGVRFLPGFKNEEKP